MLENALIIIFTIICVGGMGFVWWLEHRGPETKNTTTDSTTKENETQK